MRSAVLTLISTSSSRQMNVYYNTVYINATGPAANVRYKCYLSWANQLTATTAALNMRNNILINTSTRVQQALQPPSQEQYNTYQPCSNFKQQPVLCRNSSQQGTGSMMALQEIKRLQPKTRMSTRDQQSVEEDATNRS